MNHQTQLIFQGEILPGHDPVTVKARLAALLKLSPEQIERVFSGQRVVLHKGLPAAEVARYVAHLEQLGARVYAEPLMAPEQKPKVPQTPPAPATPPAVLPATPAKPELALAEPLVDEMNCPKCNERQPRRTLCRSCSVDMKRFAEAQETARQEAREERLAAAQGEAGGRATWLDQHTAEGEVGMLGVGFEGRLGRAEYFLGGLLSLALLMLSLQFLVRGPVPLFFVGMLASAFLSLRVTALRCHDKDLSGWMCLLIAIPYLGWLFGLVLTLMPGDKTDNRFGSPGRAVQMPAVLVVAVVFVMASLLTARSAETRLQFLALMGGQVAEARGQSSAHGNELAEVEIFTTATCGECWVAKDYLKSKGIEYYERDLEVDLPARQEFYARGGTAVPYIFVNGHTMTGFDAAVFERLRGS